MTTSTLERTTTTTSIAAAPSSSAWPASLPMPATPMFGREREVAAIRDLLASGHRRLVTLTGPGGVGKTRLAVRVAASLGDHFTGGVVFVSLATLDDPRLAARQVALSLGIRPAEHPGAICPWMTDLIAALHDRHLLLVLDNLEHLLSAAPGLVTMLDGCPALRILVTSRVPLRLSDEQEFPIAPLPLPAAALSLETAADSPSVALFVERARAIQPSFTLTPENSTAVVEICRVLDGLPLALELAAARIAHLPPTALVQRLDRRLPLLTGGHRDAPRRHRTMRDAIAWSVDLLDPEDRAVFAQLAVFAGGFTLEAAEHIASPPSRPPASSVLDRLAALIDASLIRLQPGETPRSQPRYSMLATIREYAQELLDSSGETDMVRGRLATWLADLNDQAAIGIRGPEQAVWLGRLGEEQANIRAMTTWALDRGDAETALRLTTKAAWFYWETRGLAREESPLLARALEIAEAAPEKVDPAWRGRGLVALGMRHGVSGDFARARSLLEGGVEAFREAGDEAGLTNAKSNLASILTEIGEFAGARALYEDIVAYSRDSGEPRRMLWPLVNVGATMTGQGDLETAQERLDEAARHVEQFGEQRDRAFMLYYLGEVALFSGRLGQATELLTTARLRCREIHDVRGVAISATHLALTFALAGDPITAAETLAEALERAGSVGDRPIAALALDVLAGVLLDVGRPTDAARTLGAAVAMRAAMGVGLRPVERPLWDERMRRARLALGAEALAAAEQSGRALPTDDAMAAGVLLAKSIISMDLPATPRVVTASHPIASTGSQTALGLVEPLTSREEAVLRLLVEGLSDREIADELSISSRTASSHVGRILAKLDVSSRTAATAAALRAGLV